jgi:hypothetical protein
VLPVLLACLTLEACSTIASLIPSTQQPTSPAKPQSPPQEQPRVSSRPPDAQPKLSADALPGLSMDETTILFGKPKKVAEKATAQVWEYRDGACRLSLAFYPDVETQVFHVLTYELENGGRDLDSCLVHLRDKYAARRR